MIVEKIIHLSDIHIRLYKRHEEYKESFKQLEQDLTSFIGTHPNTIIVVTGDLAHSKLDMSPESVQLMSSFLKICTSLTTTIIIAGNHDFSVNNKHRLDALTPIIDSLQIPNLFYLKDSGIIEIPGIENLEFFNFSILDESTNWPVVRPSRKTTVGLFHGPLNGARTNTGFTIDHASADISRFKGLDMLLLGDIHSPQIMNKSNPCAAYASSLIAQNYGESVDEHGWLEWDVNKKECSFHALKNKYGYITLRAPSIDEIQIPELPEYSRIRIIVNDAEHTALTKLIALLKTKTKILDISVVKNSVGAASIEDIKSNEKDVHAIEYQNELIKSFLEQKYPTETTPAMLEDIFKINKELNASLNSENIPRNIKWTPIRLEFDNLFAYGKGNVIEFENLQGLYGLFSPNASGKSSAFDCLCFALYDKTPRAFKGNHIMNARETQCRVNFSFDANGCHYVIERIGTRKPNNDVKFDVNFYAVAGGNVLLLNGNDRRDTNDAIRAIVGNYEDFILTSFSPQEKNSLFIEKGQSDKKDLFNQFRGLTIFDKLHDLATTKNKELLLQIKNFDKETFTTKLLDINTKLSSISLQLNTEANKPEFFKQNIEVINQHINDEKKKIIDLNLPDISIEDLTKKINACETLLNKVNLDIDGLSKELNSYPKIPFIPLTDTELQTLKDAQVKHRQLLTLQTELNRQREFIDIDLNNIEKHEKTLENYKYDPECVFCRQNPFVLNAQAIISKKQDLIDQKTKLLDEIASAEKEISSSAKLDKQLSDYNVRETEFTRNELKISATKTKLSELNRKAKDLETELDTFNQDLTKLLNNKDHIIFNNKILEKIKTLETQKKEQEQLMFKQALENSNLEGQKNILEETRKTLSDELLQFEEVEKEQKAYERYALAIHRNNIPYQLTKDIIPLVEERVNAILENVVDFKVLFTVDEKNITCNIVYSDDRIWPLELASGMERFVSSLAIRISLLEMTCLPKSNFLIIDEGFSSLDVAHFEKLQNIFYLLKGKFDFIVLTSHLMSMRDMVDKLIEIKQENGYSYITA